MKKIWVISAAFAFAAVCVVVLLQTKSHTRTVTAEYLILACEGCNHMQIAYSDDPDDIGKIIIPMSDAVNIEQLIDKIVLTKESVCLVGKFYKFNLNLFPIDPPGYRFEVLSVQNIGKCVGK